MFNAPPGGCPQDAGTGMYTGCGSNATATSRTIADHDLRVGDVLQFDTYDHDGLGGLASSNIGNGFILAIPTSGHLGGLAIVAGDVDDSFNEIGDVAATAKRAANCPRGGLVTIKTTGRCVRAMAKGDITKGDALCLKTTHKTYLEPKTIGTVTQEKVMVGAATAKQIAIALETANVVATNGALMWVQLSGDIGAGPV